jgi:hypothetical protein
MYICVVYSIINKLIQFQIYDTITYVFMYVFMYLFYIILYYMISYYIIYYIIYHILYHLGSLLSLFPVKFLILALLNSLS